MSLLLPTLLSLSSMKSIMKSEDRSVVIFLVCAFAYGITSGAILAYHQGAMGEIRKGNTTGGYWGPVESSVDWCEENYIQHLYMAESHNTVTSFIIAGMGVLLGFCAWKVQAEKRFYLLSLCLTIVGLGSAAFHGALQRLLQAADEVPMLWVAAVGDWICVELRNKETKHDKLPYIMFVALAFLSYINIFSIGTIAVLLFHLSFLPMELFFFFSAFKLMVRSTDAPTRQVYRWSFRLYGCAIVCWATDIVFCSQLQHLPYGLPNPQLHAYGWHLFVAVASYGLGIATLRERQAFLKQPCEMKFFLGVLPYTSMSSVTEAVAHGRSSTNGSTSKRTASTSRKKKL